MKSFLIAIALTLSICKVHAQQNVCTDSIPGIKMINGEEQHIPIRELAKYVGKKAYIFDNIWGTKQINDTLKLLYVGGRYPTNEVTILLKGRKVIQELNSLYDGVASHFSGKVIMYEGKPAMVITNVVQTGKQIML